MLKKLKPREACSIKEFRELLKECGKWLDYYDKHSLNRQINQIIFDHSLYCTLRVKMSEDDTLDGQLPNELAHLLDRNYASNMFLGFRKLFDNSHDVVSLKHLLKKLKEKSNCITREAYVCYENIPYDYQKDHNASIKKRLLENQNYLSSKVSEFSSNYKHLSEIRHKKFDNLLRISGVKSENKPSNILPKKYLIKLRMSFQTLILYVRLQISFMLMQLLQKIEKTNLQIN